MAQEGLDKGMITLREQAAAPAAVIAGQGSLFVLNETPSSLAFVGDDNATHGVLTSGAPILMSGQCNASGSYIGQYQASGLYLQSGQVFLSGEAGVSGAYVGLYAVSGWSQISGNYATNEVAYGEIFGGNIGNGIVNNYVAGVASGVVSDIVSGRITVTQPGDYFVGFQAQLVSLSGGSTTNLSLRKNNVTISGTTQQCISPAPVDGYAYREGSTQSCLVPCVSGDYLTAYQDAINDTWTINNAKLYTFMR